MRSFARSGHHLLAVLAASCLGCGEPEDLGSRGPLVELVVCELDGEPPTRGLVLQRFAAAAPAGSEVLLEAVPGRPRTFVAPGAPAGQYHLRLPDGWGHLFLNSLPRLEPGGKPVRFRVGRPHSIYAVSHQSQRLLGDVWGARRIATVAGQPDLDLAVEVEQDPSGITILRLPAARWAGPVLLMGRYVDGGLTELVSTELKDHGLPIYRELDPEPLAPLRVSVAAPAPLADDSLWAHIHVEGLPIVEHQQQPVRGGVALFGGIPTGGKALTVVLGEGAAAVRLRLPAGVWREEGEVRLHAPQGDGAIDVVLEGVTVGPDLRVQVRREDGDSYGLVPVGSSEGRPSVRLGLGRWSLLIDDGTNMRIRRVSVDGPGKVTTLADPPPEPPAIILGTLTQGAGRRLLWQREEDGRLVLGQGFVLRAGSGGRYRGRLPAGTYQLVVEDRNGQADKPRTLVLTAGMQLSLPLGG